MSNVKVTNLLHGSSASNNITLASDGTTTIPTVKATTQVLVGGVSSTANGGTLQISNGITFPATQSACSDVNTLDDYEEGTWTPTYYGGTTAGTTTYVAQIGTYTKIGRTVIIHANLNISAATGTGEVFFGGLPFPMDLTVSPIATVAVNNVNWGGGTYLGLLPGGATTIQPFYFADDLAWTNQNVVNESQQWRFTFSYNV